MKLSLCNFLSLVFLSPFLSKREKGIIENNEKLSLYKRIQYTHIHMYPYTYNRHTLYNKLDETHNSKRFKAQFTIIFVCVWGGG